MPYKGRTIHGTGPSRFPAGAQPADHTLPKKPVNALFFKLEQYNMFILFFAFRNRLR